MPKGREKGSQGRENNYYCQQPEMHNNLLHRSDKSVHFWCWDKYGMRASYCWKLWATFFLTGWVNKSGLKWNLHLPFLKQGAFVIMSGVHCILVWIWFKPLLSPGTKESAEIMLTFMCHSVASRVYLLYHTCVSVTAESLSSLLQQNV